MSMAAVRGMGVAVMTSTSGSRPRAVGARHAGPLGPEQGPLLDAEAVLLVDHGHAERREGDAVVDEGVGADDDVDLAGGQGGGELAAAGGAASGW